MSISMHDIRYLNTWEMVFQVAYITDDLCIITFFVPCLALLDACPTIISYTILNFFQAFLCLFQFCNFFYFPRGNCITSFYWILLLCCSAGWALLAFQILVHLGYYSLLFHSNSTVLHSSTSICKTELLITLKSRSWLHSFGGSLLVTSFLLIGYSSCHMEPWH